MTTYRELIEALNGLPDHYLDAPVELVATHVGEDLKREDASILCGDQLTVVPMSNPVIVAHNSLGYIAGGLTVIDDLSLLVQMKKQIIERVMTIKERQRKPKPAWVKR